ncbi:MAG: alpha/beta hydrolase [Vicinamibacterales bacterium]
MRAPFTTVAVILLVVGLAAATPRARGAVPQSPPLAGAWEGAIHVMGVTLDMRVVFTGTDASLGATIDIPQQGAAGLRLQRVTREADRVHFELPTPNATAVFDGGLEGGRITGTFTQGSASGTFTLAPARAQPPPPYPTHEVTFSNGDVTLGGTLTVPEGPGPFPAVVMLTGSGAQDRDEDILGFKVFRVIADHLTRHGVAVLRYDDRGVGQSGGSVPASTTEDFAGDALAAVALLRARPEVAADHVGLFGHSEGASVATIAAARSTDVAFVVMLAGPGQRGDLTLRQQAADGARALGADEAAVAKVVAAHAAALDAVRADAPRDELVAKITALIDAQIDTLPAAQRTAIGDRDAYVRSLLPRSLASMSNRWMHFFLDFDPTVPLGRVTCPVLAIFGSLDAQVPPAQNREPIERALSGNPRASIKVYEGANHLFQRARTGLPSEYGALDKAFVGGLLDDVTAWIRGVTGG